MAYREIICECDLILQRQKSWLFGRWENWRNLDEELRALREHEHKAFEHAHNMQRLRVIASGNIRARKEWLQANLIENSDAAFHVPVETSILEERDDVKYQWPNRNQQGKGNNNNNGKQKGKHNQQNNGNKSSRNGHSVTLRDILSAQLVIPTHH